jgi:hypothetical protein
MEGANLSTTIAIVIGTTEHVYEHMDAASLNLGYHTMTTSRAPFNQITDFHISPLPL